MKKLGEVGDLAISFFFGFAVFSTYFFIIILTDFPDIPFRLFIYGALVEEILKFSSILVLVLLFKINPMGTLSLGAGYGFGEGLSHFWYPEGSPGLIALWMHLIVGVIMSLLVVKAFKMKSKLYFALALLVPIALHGFYNSHLLKIIVYLMPY